MEEGRIVVKALVAVARVLNKRSIEFNAEK